ncbi:hypothetical protein Cantr_03853 [Candida viswanathii]|uniref:Binder of USO1 and GRH1 protein 1 n=1 Tax=Candida viswanathii TaxID=5486 RepID=A0A367XNK0_9ASCO|nr:hypothetical protein Cantr_03853 [Candida viswanathii]
MSDKEQDQLTEDTSDTELSKEERLEAARKKFEELKKKNKKKKGKKSKKLEGAEESTAENTPAPEEDAEEEVKDDAEEKKEEVKEEPKEEPTAEVKEEPKEEPKEAPKEETKLEEPPSTESTSEPLGDYVKQIEELKQTIEQQKSTIKKLRDENTDLKLSKMDLNDKIHSLELENKNLKALTSSVSAGQSATASPAAVFRDTVKPAKPVFTRNDYASISQQSFTKFNATDDFREKLMVWKGWQVDMTNWNGSGATQKVAL